ncbi:MAG: PIN domain-containing protein [Geitlerinemataceae cyanobacterium]
MFRVRSGRCTFSIRTRLIYYFKRRGCVAERFAQVDPEDAILSTIVLYELQVGMEKAGFPPRQIADLEGLLNDTRRVAFDRAAAEAAAFIRASLEARGAPIGPIDVLIAGVALSLDATLVTHNTREFSRIPNLAIVDWF